MLLMSNINIIIELNKKNFWIIVKFIAVVQPMISAIIWLRK